MKLVRHGAVPGLALLALLGCTDAAQNPCDGVTCSGRGYCLVGPDGPYCGCIPGFHTVARTTCEPDDSTEPCRGIDCLGHGSCRVEAGAPVCDCDPGYAYLEHPQCDAIRCELLCIAASPPDGGPEADACLPVAEACDGLDNDCNGLVDEAFDLDFDPLNCGACGAHCPDAQHGTGTCILGTCALICEPGWSDLDREPATGCEAVCTPADTPDESLCEGRDDDCDGLTDEDWTSSSVCGLGVCTRDALCFRGEIACRPRLPPSATDATCDNIDDDCDGSTDEDCPTGADADADADAPADVVPDVPEDVEPEADVPPTPECGNGRVETGEQCDDGNDVDTDGCTSDCRNASCGDGYIFVGHEECDGAAPIDCTTTCGSTGSRACVDCQWTLACTPPPETCNGADDDCDTVADDGFTCRRGATGTCTTSCGSTGSRTCSTSCTWGSCIPPSESCNGTDDDCDGVCDDGYACCRGTSGTCTASTGCPGTRTCSTSCAWGTCTAPLRCVDIFGGYVCDGNTGIVSSGCTGGWCKRCTCNNGVWTGCTACTMTCPV